MTDEQVIKALECCGNIIVSSCKDCPFHEKYNANCVRELTKEALDLIKRQQAEIERYKTLYEDLKAENLETIKAIKDYKTEAINDFVAYFYDECVTFDNGVTLLVDKEDFDNLVKELTEGK